jgi:hypothetical protein
MTAEQLREAAAVMLAAADGKAIECRHRSDNNEEVWREAFHVPVWNWYALDYRIRPEPVKVRVRLYQAKSGETIRSFTEDETETLPSWWTPISDWHEVEVTA